MTVDLRERLRAAAEGAPEHLAADGLWERGRRYQRRRRTGAAVVVTAVLALVAIGGVALQREPHAVGPAGTAVRPGLPDRLFVPSPWLPGTDARGPLGPLATAFPAERKSLTSTSTALVGVSATTGEYRFLDLPDLPPTIAPAEVTVSPNGLRLAYWATGTTSDTPNTTHGPPLVGIDVYDTVTGQVRSERVPSPHGISAEQLLWVDDTALVWQYATIDRGDDDPHADQVSAVASPPRLWRPGQSRSRELAAGPERPTVYGVTAAGELVLAGGHDSYRLVDPDRPAEARTFRSKVSTVSGFVSSPSGRRLASIWAGPVAGAASLPNQVVVVDVPRGGTARVPTARERRVPHTETTEDVVGWTDEQHVLRIGQAASGPLSVGLVSTDVDTGRTTPYLDLGQVGAVTLATGLFDEPRHRAVAPPSPVDPRLVGGLGLAVVVAVVVALVLRRRDVRA